MSDLLERVIRHEGFRDKPYQDSVGVWTIGHGLTYLTEEESKAIVDRRLAEITERLMAEHPFLFHIVGAAVDVLAEMVFQLGWTGCHNFKYMWAALEAGNYGGAANEMIDSKWHAQTPSRCEELAGIIRSL